ncbi:MAG: hypothetical protein EBY32_16865, partial [Proteobacteria bacterium]|nr:hypothetical protein [Pseudomonadota bacterium]
RYLFPGTQITIWTYFWGIVFVTAVTAAYTAVGGIKAVVWTDLIQACLMCGAVVFAIFTILNHIPGGLGKVNEMLDGHQVAMFQTGWEATKPFGDALRQMLENPYTILAAILGSTFLTMATHGTDQDMVQRMLTAENINKSRLSLIVSGFADIPVVLAFLAVGILLWVYYQICPDPSLPTAHNEIFAHYIVHEMPAGIRGLIVAGVFATMMGSTSAALNPVDPRRTHSDLRFCGSHDPRRHRGRLCGAGDKYYDHSARSRSAWLRLRLAPRHLPARRADKVPRQRCRECLLHALRHSGRPDSWKSQNPCHRSPSPPEIRVNSCGVEFRPFHANLVAGHLLALLRLHRQHGHLRAGRSFQILPDPSNQDLKLKSTARRRVGEIIFQVRI